MASDEAQAADGPSEAAWRVSVPAEDQLVVEIFVRDVARSTAFYRRLGFELLRDAGDFVELTWGGCKLFLDQRPDLPAVPARPQANVRVMVPDVDACWDLVRSIGAPVLEEIGDRYYGLRDFTILDPDGFGVRFGMTL
jgi:catechol 2,3-dioxygenase-like lactoylglutathione lyase family enzyme